MSPLQGSIFTVLGFRYTPSMLKVVHVWHYIGLNRHCWQIKPKPLRL